MPNISMGTEHNRRWEFVFEHRDTWADGFTGPQYESLLSIYQDWTRYLLGHLLHHWIYLIAFSVGLGYILFRLVSVTSFSVWMISFAVCFSAWEINPGSFTNGSAMLCCSTNKLFMNLISDFIPWHQRFSIQKDSSHLKLTHLFITLLELVIKGNQPKQLINSRLWMPLCFKLE